MVYLENPDVHIRELEQIMAWIIGKETGLCNGMARCANWVSVDENGDLYPCEYFKAEYTYGNILEIDLSDITTSTAFNNYSNLFMTPPEKCKSCEFAKYCGNGCPGTRTSGYVMDPAGVDFYCEAKKLAYDHISSVFAQYS